MKYHFDLSLLRSKTDILHYGISYKWELLAEIFLQVCGMEPLQIFLKTPWWQLKTLRRHSGSFVLKQILHGSKSLIYVPRKVTKLFSVFDFLSSGKTITCWEG